MPGREIKSNEVADKRSPSEQKGKGLPLSFDKALLAKSEAAKRQQENTRKDDRKRQKVSDENKTHTIEDLKEATNRQNDENARLKQQVEQAGDSQSSELPTYALQPITKLIGWTVEGQQFQQQADLTQMLQQQAITKQEVSRGTDKKTLEDITNISHDHTKNTSIAKNSIVEEIAFNNIQTEENLSGQKRGAKRKALELNEQIPDELKRINVDSGDSPEVREKKMEAEVKQTREKQKEQDKLEFKPRAQEQAVKTPDTPQQPAKKQADSDSQVMSLKSHLANLQNERRKAQERVTALEANSTEKELITDSLRNLDSQIQSTQSQINQSMSHTN